MENYFKRIWLGSRVQGFAELGWARGEVTSTEEGSLTNLPKYKAALTYSSPRMPCSFQSQGLILNRPWRCTHEISVWEAKAGAGDFEIILDHIVKLYWVGHCGRKRTGGKWLRVSFLLYRHEDPSCDDSSSFKGQCSCYIVTQHWGVRAWVDVSENHLRKGKKLREKGIPTSASGLHTGLHWWECSRAPILYLSMFYFLNLCFANPIVVILLD